MSSTVNSSDRTPISTMPAGGTSTLAPAARIDWPTLLPFGIAIALLAALAAPVMGFWWWEYTQPESYYAHAPAIPLIVALMLWYRRDALGATPKRPAMWAIPLVAGSLALLVFAIKRELEAVESMALLCVIWSSVLMTLGIRFFRAAAFPLLFLILMAPLPGPLLRDATFGMQNLSTGVAVKILHLCTFYAARVGNVINMDNFSLSVDVPCSGFKLLLAMTTFSAAFAYLIDGSAKRRLALFLIALPLSLIVNSVRVALIGIVGDCIGPDAAHVFHDWSGMITLVLGFVVLFSLAKGFGCRKFAGWPIF
jgi:exosortase